MCGRADLLRYQPPLTAPRQGILQLPPEGTGQDTMPGDGTTNGVAVPLRFDTALTGISGVYLFDHVRLGR